jgi:hypothetical protein
MSDGMACFQRDSRLRRLVASDLIHELGGGGRRLNVQRQAREPDPVPSHHGPWAVV